MSRRRIGVWRRSTSRNWRQSTCRRGASTSSPFVPAPSSKVGGLRDLDLGRGTTPPRRHEEYAELHGSCFYEAKCPSPDVIEGMVMQARTFVEDVRAALIGGGRRGGRGSWG